MKIIINKNVGFKDFSKIKCLLDKVTTGSLIIIGSRPAIGKTRFIAEILSNLEDKKCLYFLLEMSKQQNPYLHLLKSRNNLIIDYKTNCIEDIEAKIKLHKPDYVFINYLQLIHGENNGIFYTMKEIVRKLKEIAKENNAAIVLASQLSRKLETREDKRPQITDIREYPKIDEVADLIMLLHRDDYYNKENPELINKLEVIIRKNNFGNGDSIYLELIEN